jgi:DNA-binding MarR family transcriptional regulator
MSVNAPHSRPHSRLRRAREDEHAACLRAWHTLRLVYEQIARRLAAELATECTLTRNEFDVLHYLRSHPAEEVRLTALLEAAALSQPALSRLVTRLESRGLLARSGVEVDGRVCVVTLTDAGAALADRAVAIHARTVHEALTGKLSPADQATLLKTLSRISQ